MNASTCRNRCSTRCSNVSEALDNPCWSASFGCGGLAMTLSKFADSSVVNLIDSTGELATGCDDPASVETGVAEPDSTGDDSAASDAPTFGSSAGTCELVKLSAIAACAATCSGVNSTEIACMGSVLDGAASSFTSSDISQPSKKRGADPKECAAKDPQGDSRDYVIWPCANGALIASTFQKFVPSLYVPVTETEPLAVAF